MNIYEKLLQVRLELSTANIKKGGKNEFAKYEYLELNDFLPALIKSCASAKICPLFSFGETAKLTIVDAEKPEDFIEFSSPIAELQMKGTNALQIIGGVQTYLRRYLFIMAFDIATPDVFDAGGKEANPVKANPAMYAKLAKKADELGCKENLRHIITSVFKKPANDLLMNEANELLLRMETYYHQWQAEQAESNQADSSAGKPKESK